MLANKLSGRTQDMSTLTMIFALLAAAPRSLKDELKVGPERVRFFAFIVPIIVVITLITIAIALLIGRRSKRK